MDKLKAIITSHRFWMMGIAALAVIVLDWCFAVATDGAAGTAQTMIWLHSAARPLVLLALVYLSAKAFSPGDAKSAWAAAMGGNIAAAVLVLARYVLIGLLFLAFTGNARANSLPDRAAIYLPVLSSEVSAHWPDVPVASALAAQVEQETCPSLKSAKCWNPRAELKTAREHGIGLGQCTVTEKFNCFSDAARLDRSLASYDRDRYNPQLQLRTLVLMDRDAYKRLAMVIDQRERQAMSFSAYNGGLGGVLADRRLCAQVAGCDPGKWFGHVELHSLKARTKSSGYGQSFFDINRGYVRAVMVERRQKYVTVMRS